ncbi:uncharacterized protein LOC129571863 [Sitodiplosis mosellana]|uniref:uncharacterized protein LOC129571863 n=1 Tax=Sitodiplosis mosellana TaxID=263140 RepID=UPI002444E95F|nr:uncharacterized protein LOC129571863 [Sitodiplosis mosellana]
MGINVAPTIANFVTNEIIEQVLDNLDWTPKMLMKYVDDIFKIVFTVEKETNGTLPYLDLLIQRGDNNDIKVDWYQKPTAANRILNFQSQHPLKQKEAVAYGYFRRVLSIVDDEFKQKNIEKIISILRENAYPMRVIKAQLNKFIRNQNRPPQTPSQRTSEPIRRKRFSYFPVISEDIKQVFKGKNEHLELAFKPMNQLGETVFTKLKQKIETPDQINAVYKIPCGGKENEPCSKSYVGQTKNRVRVRMYAYKTSTKHVTPNYVKPVAPDEKSDDNKTALPIHAENTGHQLDFVNVSILDTEQFLSRRLVNESLHIYCNDSMNLRRDVQGISKTYASVLQSVKARNKQSQRRNVKSNAANPMTVTQPIDEEEGE